MKPRRSILSAALRALPTALLLMLCAAAAIPVFAEFPDITESAVPLNTAIRRDSGIALCHPHEEGRGSIMKGIVSFDPAFSLIDTELLKKDLEAFDWQNEDEQKVIDAAYISAYKQTLVIKLPMGYNGASFGVIFLGDKITDPQTVRHEYGHTRQLLEMGYYLYTVDVAIPSMMANLLSRQDKLPYDYYGSYWEADADKLGKVSRAVNYEEWPKGADSSIWKLAAMFD